MAENWDLGSNALCVAVRVATGCRSAIHALASESFGRPFNWDFMMRFSAARHSFCANSSWSTNPSRDHQMPAQSITDPCPVLPPATAFAV